MADVFPPAEDGFIKWLDSYVTGATPNPPKFGATVAEIVAITATQTQIKAAVTRYKDLKTQLAIALKEKGALLKDGKTQARVLAHKAHSMPDLTEADLTSIALRAPTPKSGPKAAAATSPFGILTAHGHASLEVSIRASSSSKSKAKPPNTHACQIWLFKGETQPADPSAYTFQANETKSTAIIPFLAVDSGKTVWMLLRWESTTGKLGPWSEAVSARIPV